MTQEELNNEIKLANKSLEEQLDQIETFAKEILIEKLHSERFANCIQVFEVGFGDFVDGASYALRSEVIVNWSACGSQDEKTAIGFGEALVAVGEKVIQYNRNRQCELERLEALAKHLSEEK